MDPNVNPSVPAAPASIEDALFSDLFSDELGVTPSPATTPASTGTTPPAAINPAQPAAQDFFLEAPTGSKYRTREDAINGLAVKDQTIEDLRQFAIQHTGVDPLKKGPAAGPAPQGNDSYLQDPSRYYQDLEAAYKRNDPKAYFEAQNRLVRENLAATLNPLQPLVSKMIVNEAMEKVSTEFKDFREFRGGDDYKAVLQENPTLANAIQVAEADVNMGAQLPELYRLVRMYSQAKKSTQLAVDAAEQARAAAAAAAQAPRPSATPSSVPPATSSVVPTDWKTNPAARKAYIEQGLQRGLDKVDMGTVIPVR